jgi:hypothetical protein
VKNYYIAQVQVIIEGKDNVIVSICGEGYDPNEVKQSAENKIRKNHVGKRITSVILSKVDLDLEEYKSATGGNPPWHE